MAARTRKQRQTKATEQQQYVSSSGILAKRETAGVIGRTFTVLRGTLLSHETETENDPNDQASNGRASQSDACGGKGRYSRTGSGNGPHRSRPREPEGSRCFPQPPRGRARAELRAVAFACDW